MDGVHGFDIVPIRPWLIVTGSIEGLLIVVMIATACIYKLNCMSTSNSQILIKFLIILVILKLFIGTFSYLDFLLDAIIRHCSGGFLAYVIIATIAHIVFLVLLCIMR